MHVLDNYMYMWLIILIYLHLAETYNGDSWLSDWIRDNVLVPGICILKDSEKFSFLMEMFNKLEEDIVKLVGCMITSTTCRNINISRK